MLLSTGVLDRWFWFLRFFIESNQNYIFGLPKKYENQLDTLFHDEPCYLWSVNQWYHSFPSIYGNRPSFVQLPVKKRVDYPWTWWACCFLSGSICIWQKCTWYVFILQFYWYRVAWYVIFCFWCDEGNSDTGRHCQFVMNLMILDAWLWGIRNEAWRVQER